MSAKVAKVAGFSLLAAALLAGAGGIAYAIYKSKKACAVGKHYDSASKTCVEDPPDTECPCQKTYSCVNKKCIKDPACTCTDFGETCDSGGLCVCTDESCPHPAYGCVDGKCQKLDACAGLTCGREQICVAGKCTCTEGGSCPFPKACQSDECVDRSCLSDVECPAGSVCFGGVCTLKPKCPPGQIYVGQHNDCEIPEKCLEGNTLDQFSNKCVWSGLSGLVGMGFIPTITPGTHTPDGYEPVRSTTFDFNLGSAGYMYGFKKVSPQTTQGWTGFEVVGFDKANKAPCSSGWVAATDPDNGEPQDINKGAGLPYLYVCGRPGSSQDSGFIRDISAANYGKNESCESMGTGWVKQSYSKGKSGNDIHFCLKY